MVAISTRGLAALSTDQAAHLVTADIAAMTMAQAVAFSTAGFAALSSAQINALVGVSPIMLNLDGHGVSTVSAAHGVQFDLGGTGKTSQVGWVGGGDGLLVMDRNGDGKINDGRELFGAGTVLANGQLQTS